MAAELAQARSHVYLTGWQFSPDFPLVRDEQPPVILRNLLAELAERVDVRVLVWAGAPLPLFRPSRGQVKQMQQALCKGNAIQCGLDARERPLHCHHEKTIVIDDRIAFVGGIDLTTENRRPLRQLRARRTGAGRLARREHPRSKVRWSPMWRGIFACAGTR